MVNRSEDEKCFGVSERARKVKQVPSREMTDMVEALKSKGKDIIVMKGGPYWLPPEHVLEAAAKAVKDLTAPPSNGFAELRRAISDKLEGEDRIVVDPESEILITHGGMHALNLVFATLLDPGDEVIMYSPGFFFNGVIKLNGAVPVYAETREEDNWHWDAGGLEKLINSKTKMIVVNSPTNPTGYVANEDDQLAIAELARKYDLLILSDECYDNMIYDDARHIRFASLPGIKDRLITVCSFTKSYALRHFRVGYIVASSNLTPYIRKILEWDVLTCNHVAQRAAQAALEGPQDWVKQIAPRYQKNRDLMVDGLRLATGISFAIPKGTPFLFINTSGLNISGEEFSRVLLHDYCVAAEPGTLFGSNTNRYVRLMFGGSEDVVREVAMRISSATRRLAQQGHRKLK